jgi:radical SAM protein with 4Fe4S-binding SPASM domain
MTAVDVRSGGGAAPRGIAVIFKGTNACNGGCTFCSVGLGGDRRIGWPEFESLAGHLERIVAERGLERLDFTFHGGEPTLLGPDFLDRACRRLEQLPATVAFSMQSNLLAVTDDFLAVAREHRIQIGSSIDPIGAGRRTRSGEDAFPRWLEGYARTVSAGFGVGSIFVVTRAALGRAREVYRAAEALAVLGQRPGLQVNPVYPQGEAGEGVLVTPEELGRFFVEIWRIWEESGRSVQLTPIASLARSFEDGPGGPPSLPCAFAGDCSTTHVGIDHDLRVAGCGRRLDSGAFFGVLTDGGFSLSAAVQTSGEKRTIAQRAAALAAGPCSACRFFPLCHGGCPDDAALAGDLAGRTPWCAGYRALFEAMEKGVKRRTPEARPSLPVGATLLFAALDVVAPEPEPSSGEVLERWLLPAEDGRALRFDAGLDRLLASRAGRLVIWVSARHVRSLAMWRDVLRDGRVSVGLLEGGEALPGALNALNGLGARVLLDVPAVAAAEGGAGQLDAAWVRFLTDPLWRVPVLPFAPMLRAGVDRVQAPLVDWRGLPRGSTRVVAAEGAAEALGRLAPDLVAAPVDRDAPARWMAAHRGCVVCDELRICGGALATGPDHCTAPLRELVRQIGARAAEIRRRLEDAEAA